MVFALPGDPPPANVVSVPARRPTSRPSSARSTTSTTRCRCGTASTSGKLAQGDFGTNFRGVKVRRTSSTQRYPTTAQARLHGDRLRDRHRHRRRVLAGIRKGKFIDNLVLVSTLFVISIPIFVIGGTLQYYLGVKLGLFPVTVSPRRRRFYELLLPAFVLGSRLDRLRRAPDPHQPRREPARRLRAHRHGQGPDPAAGHRRARPAQLADPGRHLHRCRLRWPARWRHRHRAHLQHPGRRWLPLPGIPDRDGVSSSAP